MRLSQLLKAKIHHAHVSYANPDYIGSIEIDRAIMDHVGIVDGELVHVWAVDTMSRIQTYAFAGPAGVIGLNGGAARYFSAGDRIVIAAFDLSDEPLAPIMVLLDDDNRIVKDIEPFSILG